MVWNQQSINHNGWFGIIENAGEFTWKSDERMLEDEFDRGTRRHQERYDCFLVKSWYLFLWWESSSSCQASLDWQQPRQLLCCSSRTCWERHTRFKLHANRGLALTDRIPAAMGCGSFTITCFATAISVKAWTCCTMMIILIVVSKCTVLVLFCCHSSRWKD